MSKLKSQISSVVEYEDDNAKGSIPRLPTVLCPGHDKILPGRGYERYTSTLAGTTRKWWKCLQPACSLCEDEGVTAGVRILTAKTAAGPINLPLANILLFSHH